MKLTVAQVRDATLVISQIIREQRPMSQRGKFRLARLHAKLLPEFNTIEAQRDALIKEHGSLLEGETDKWSVNPEHMDAFNEAWAAVAGEEIEVDATPIPIGELDAPGVANGSIEAHEIIVLGDMITD